jgi:hypothetical protein
VALLALVLLTTLLLENDHFLTTAMSDNRRLYRAAADLRVLAGP